MQNLIPINAAVVAEIIMLRSWYRLSRSEMDSMLLGVSLGLKVQGIVLPDLELAISCNKPEIFLGMEERNDEQRCLEAVNQQVLGSSYG